MRKLPNEGDQQQNIRLHLEELDKVLQYKIIHAKAKALKQEVSTERLLLLNSQSESKGRNASHDSSLEPLDPDLS